MRVVIVLALVSMSGCVPLLRGKRSFDHEYYDDTLYSSPDVYTYRQPAYSTQSVAPVYHVPGRTEVHTTSATRYTVRVPVTYTYTVDQPVRHSTVYSAPRAVYSAPRAVYSAPTEVYSDPATWRGASWEPAVDTWTDDVISDPWC